MRDHITIGGGLLGDDFLTDEEDEGTGRKSRIATDIDIDELK
jgi:hypothetical protein